MDDPRFGGWTRRRLHLAAGSAVASILGLVAHDESAADRLSHARKPGCRKLKARCRPKGKKLRCCDKVNQLHCDHVGTSGLHCCRDYQQVCSGPGECCRNLTCGAVPALSGSRCCGGVGTACRTANDCCDAVGCIGGICNLAIFCADDGTACPSGCDLAGSCVGCCGGYCNGDGTCGPNA
jgi:hypothetical protein